MKLTFDNFEVSYNGEINQKKKPHGNGSFIVIDKHLKDATIKTTYYEGKLNGLGKLKTFTKLIATMYL